MLVLIATTNIDCNVKQHHQSWEEKINQILKECNIKNKTFEYIISNHNPKCNSKLDNKKQNYLNFKEYTKLYKDSKLKYNHNQFDIILFPDNIVPITDIDNIDDDGGDDGVNNNDVNDNGVDTSDDGCDDSLLILQYTPFLKLNGYLIFNSKKYKNDMQITALPTSSKRQVILYEYQKYGKNNYKLIYKCDNNVIAVEAHILTRKQNNKNQQQYNSQNNKNKLYQSSYKSPQIFQIIFYNFIIVTIPKISYLIFEYKIFF